MGIPKTWKGYCGTKYHFVSEAIDGDRVIILFKYWRNTKQRWTYGCNDKYLLERFEWSEDNENRN